MADLLLESIVFGIDKMRCETPDFVYVLPRIWGLIFKNNLKPRYCTESIIFG